MQPALWHVTLLQSKKHVKPLIFICQDISDLSTDSGERSLRFTRTSNTLPTLRIRYVCVAHKVPKSGGIELLLSSDYFALTTDEIA